MTKPNFFIVGAPKCGTTALYRYLQPHPDIFMPSIKEPYYFGSDFTGKRLERFDQESYLDLFDSAQDEKRIGEASTWYLYSRHAAEEIKAFNPHARIIIMLRSPVDMLYSLYYQLLYTHNEDLSTFEMALKAEPDRQQGKRMPATLRMMPETLFYRETGKFTAHVQRYFEVFGRDSVHVIIYDDFKADTAAVYQDTLHFLDVDTAFKSEFEVVNANKLERNYRFQSFLLEPPSWIMQVGKRILPIARPVYWQLRKMNHRNSPRPPLAPETRKQLQQDLLPDIEQLSILLKRDLTHWCR